MTQWQDVPALVVHQYHEVLPVAVDLADIAAQSAGVHTVWYNAKEKQAAFLGDPLIACRFAQIDGVSDVTIGMPEAGADWVLCKTAGIFSAPARMWGDAQRMIGGVSPVASMITGGLMAGGVGYGGAAIAGRNLPEEEQRELRRKWAMRAGILGALPGATWGATQYLGNPDKLHSTLRDRGAGWFSSWPFNTPPELPQSNPPPAVGPANTIVDNNPLAQTKLSADQTGASLGVPSIPVDAFNEVVWNDVNRPANPFGTKSPWGDNSQSLGTPAQVAATTSGLLAGASAARGGAEMVSPLDIAAAAAVGGGKGWLAGLVLGKTLSALAGLSPDTQRMLQQTGFWGGALTAAVQRAF